MNQLDRQLNDLRIYWRAIWRSRATWIRALVCLAIGAAVLFNEDLANFDLRLQIRGPRPASPEILIVDISERDWNALDPDMRNVLRPLKEVINLSDAFFWNARTWQHLLANILSGSPKAIGVVFFFGENLRMSQNEKTFSDAATEVFENPKVVWGADIDSAGRVLVPVFSTTYYSNVGLRGLRADDDGTVRRFASSTTQVPYLGVRLAQVSHPELSSIESSYQEPTMINYDGGSAVFRVVSFGDVMHGRISPSVFKNKTVIVGSLTSPLEQLQTPLGRMSRTEITANIVDNIITARTVHRLQNWIYLALLTLLMAGSIWILSSYPQTVTLVFFVLAAIVWSSFSVWAFDVALFWVPVLAPLVQLLLTYMVFISYRLTINEQKTWRLQQEQKYLSEIEQLKTNFVSMMSHDLKTPIAKIQAICDRLLSATVEAELAQDLKSLRRSSDDLHRYIQSILQVTKVEAKDFKINKEVTDINENIEKVISRLQPLADEKKIRISTSLEPLFSIEADTTLLQEVVHNLVENAIKFTPEGGRVSVTSEEKDDNVTVVVEDTGPGISLEDQPEIWGKFIRGRNQKVDTKGTGLGLYLVKYFIELHGGNVFLSSQPGHGTRIGFSIPVETEKR